MLVVSSEVVPYMPQSEQAVNSFQSSKRINDNGGLTRIFMPKYVIIGLIVVIGTFLIMNYWPKLKEQTKNRILMVIFGIFFISIFVLPFLLMF